MGLIVLTTDFGLSDGYVGVLKGVILGIDPAATIVDLCHLVAPQDVAGGAFVLGTAYRHFPPLAVHVVVVDPGVGGERRAVALRTPAGTFVGPDNGVLTWVLREHGLAAAEPGRVALAGAAPGVEAVELANPRYWLPVVSATFHGRDVFAPVAAHLGLGLPLAEVGPPLADLAVLAAPLPRRQADAVVGQVLHVDHFGNLVTSLALADLAHLGPAEQLELVVRGRTAPGLRHHYAAGSGLGALLGSAGLLEVALTGGSAAAALGAGVGDEVLARRAAWVGRATSRPDAV